MAAFGISFPKLTLCRSTTSKADPNTVSTTTTTGARTLSLSIKNVPSQPLHYDVSTTAVKKKTSSIATILAIDGETKQLPKNLSVFNELQLDDEPEDINGKRRRQENSSDIIVPLSLSPMGTIDHRPDIRFLANVDSKKILPEEKQTIQEQKSNHTFTPPTSSLSNDSIANDLHLSLSSISVDFPQLKYAIEKFLINDDEPIYHTADDFPSGSSLLHQDCNINAHSSNVSTSDMKHCQHDKLDSIEVSLMPEKNSNDKILSRFPSGSANMKWYVSELRINRPLIYRTNWTYDSNRKLSQSVNDLKQLYNITNDQKNTKHRRTTEKINYITYSTLSLQNFHQSNDNILLHNHSSGTDDEEDYNLSSLVIQRTLGRSLDKDDTLIRNESVKKKLFAILNDDELENACLEDMSQEFEKMSLTHHHQIINSLSSSSDDALYSSPPNELHLPLPLSSSYHENLSSNNTTERYLGRSRLITTSLDKIPMDNTSYEHTRPSWYTSPSPQWRMDDQLPITSGVKRYASKKDDPNRFESDIKENKYYSLMNTTAPLVDDSKKMLPIIQDNLLMFI